MTYAKTGLQRAVLSQVPKCSKAPGAPANCDHLVSIERHQDVQRAIAGEKELKGWRRAKKIALIELANAAWVDLSHDWYDCEPANYRRALVRMDA